MPFRKWAVEPVFLSRKQVPPDKQISEFYTVTNHSLVNCMKQLSSLVKIADKIFIEITKECRLVVERTERLQEKIESCQAIVSKLDARAVSVPVSDMSQAAHLLRTRKPYKTNYEKASQLFLPSTRPPCVDRLYNQACTTPVAVMCTIDKYRTDGLSSSQLFMVTPVLGGARRRRKKLLDIETRKPANFTLAKEVQEQMKCGVSERLPSPEEQALQISLEYPSSIVPVDTTGTSFTRMSLLRKSLIHAEFVIKRKRNKKKSKRRHTICEGENKRVGDTTILVHSSCQTDTTLSLDRRRISVPNELDSFKQEFEAADEDKSPSKTNSKKGGKYSLKFSPISSLSAALSMVKMRGRHDDGRSSSGNWSASSSTRASVDSDHGVGSPSRSSAGKDSLLSDVAQQDQNDRSRDETDIPPIKQKRYTPVNPPWAFDPGGVSTPDRCSSNPRSPCAGRRGVVNDDGDSSVYSVDADGYYTSMHTDSGLWGAIAESQKRQESESSVSTLGSINSFLSKSATECSSDSIKRGPPPPPRISSCNHEPEDRSPMLQNGSASESEHEVQDRIRAKTAITAHRYPSMCAVSPETSDDETSDWNNTSVVVAQVHREEKTNEECSSQDSSSLYGSESLYSTHQTPLTSTPRSGVTTFTQDARYLTKEDNVKQKSLQETNTSSNNTAPDKSLIPLKYAQCITVTPIARNDSPSLIKKSSIRPSSTIPSLQYSVQGVDNSLSPTLTAHINRTSNSPIKSSLNENSQRSPVNSLPRSIARVTLDPSGKVVYSSNSLDRSGNLNQNKNVTMGFATLPMCQAQANIRKSTYSSKDGDLFSLSKNSLSSSKQNSPEDHNKDENAPGYLKNHMKVINDNNDKSSISLSLSMNNASKNPENVQNQNSTLDRSSSIRDFNFRPSRGGRFCRSYFPTHLISSPSNNKAETPIAYSSSQVTSTSPISNSSHSQLNNTPNSNSYSSNPTFIRPTYLTYKSPQQTNSPSNIVPNSQNKLSSDSYTISSVNTNFYWPQRHTLRYNNYHQPHSTKSYSQVPSSSERTSSYSNNFLSKPPDLIPSGESPPSTLDITSPASNHRSNLYNKISDMSNNNKTDFLKTKNGQDSFKSLTANELFAIIHNSKKKHNIKTESEKSLSPLSSRSASPALSQSSLPTKLQPIETGVLSKRYTDVTNSTPSNLGRKGTTQERLSLTKPTSMHDFKMLLLQTRTGTGDLSPRPSAAELLKVSPPKSFTGSSPKTPVTSSLFKSSIPTPNYSYSPGHGTVPFKRGIRTRSPYLTRYDSAYPPIMEDCSEETESCFEQGQNYDSKPRLPYIKKMEPVIGSSTTLPKATSTWV